MFVHGINAQHHTNTNHTWNYLRYCYNRCFLDILKPNQNILAQRNWGRWEKRGNALQRLRRRDSKANRNDERQFNGQGIEIKDVME